MTILFRPIRLEFLFHSLLALGLFFALGVATSFAAADDYTVSGGNPAALPTVGDASVALPTITITDVGGDDFTNDPENIGVNINVAQYNNVAFDNTVLAGALTIAGTCTYDGANALTYSADRQSVTIPITDSIGNECAAGQTITITGLKIVTRYAQTAPGAAEALITVDNSTTSLGAPVSTSNGVQLASTADDAAATVTLQNGNNSVVGLNGTTTVAFTLGYPLANTDTVVFTMPAWISVTNGAFTGETDGFAGAGSFDCAGVSATRVVTCTANGVIDAGTSNIVFASGDVLSNYVATGTNAITDFAINFVADGGGGNDVGNDATVTITNTTVGTLTSTSMTPATPANSNLTSYTIAFTTVGTTMANGAKIKVTFPSGYDLSSVSSSATSLSGLDGTWNASVSGQILTLTQSGGGSTAPGAKALQISNLRNPATTGATGTFTLLTTTGADASIQTATPAAVTIQAGMTSTASIADPSGITISDNGDGGVLIIWDNPLDDTTHVQILKGTAPLPVSGTVYATVDVSKELYVDYDVEEGDVVSYILRGTDGSDTGDLSDEYSFTVGSGETTDEGEDATIGEEDIEDTTDDISEDTSDDTSDETTDEETDEGQSTVFEDLSGHWAEDEVSVMTEVGVVQGHPDGKFDPDGSLNRAEAAALLWRVLLMGDAVSVSEDPFSDVAHGEWYASYIAGLKGLDLVEGNPDGSYEPAESINRAEFLQLAMNVYLYWHSDMETEYEELAAAHGDMTTYVDLDHSAWYAGLVSAATKWGFVNGSACEEGRCFNAASSITRAEATVILYRMFQDLL